MTDMNKLKATVYARLEAIAGAEKITKVELRSMSREVLEYVPATDDIDLVNRLIGVLTPMNKKTAILFFTHFLPWEVERDNDKNFVRFGKRMKGNKKVNDRFELITEFLADEKNSIWTWSDQNVEIKQKDFRNTIQNAIKKALEGDAKSDTPALSKVEVVDVLFSSGISIEDMMAGIAVEEARKAGAEEVDKLLHPVQEAA